MRTPLFFVAILVAGGGSRTFVLRAVVAGDDAPFKLWATRTDTWRGGGGAAGVGGSHAGVALGEGRREGVLRESMITAVTNTSRRGVAVCLGGQLRSLRLTLDSFRAYVLESLLAPSPDASDAAVSTGEPGSGEPADGEEEALLLLEEGEGEEEEEVVEEVEQKAEEAEVGFGGSVVAATGQKRKLRRRIAMPDLFVYAPTPSASELAAFAKLMEATKSTSGRSSRSTTRRSALSFGSQVRLRGVRFGDERFVHVSGMKKHFPVGVSCEG